MERKIRVDISKKKLDKISESGDSKRSVARCKNYKTDTLFANTPGCGDSAKKPVNLTDNINREIKKLDLQERKRIRDKYTIRLWTQDITNKNMDSNVEIKEVKTSKSTINLVSTPTKESIIVELPKTDAHRTPLIKTTTAHKDKLRIYKDVTFIEEKRQPVPLLIKVPLKKEKSPRFTYTNFDKNVFSTVREKRYLKKTGKRKHLTSPASVKKGNFSPPTEVAKWAPTCLTDDTKPYYEAWVNTKLAAVTKDFNLNENEKADLLKTYRRTLDRIQSPELVYKDLTDEKFTGRIKVRQHRRKN